MIKQRPKTITDWLEGDGWFSPNTYSNNFKPIEQISSVYIFMLVDLETFADELVAYVGMSRKLKQRLVSHEVKAEIDKNELYWVKTWFKPVPVVDLRNTELSYIRKFDPPWNIIGRTRGIPVQ